MGTARPVATRIDAPEARDAAALDAQLVDVLPRSTYDEEHLPGAISLPLESLDADTARTTLDPQRAIIVGTGEPSTNMTVTQKKHPWSLHQDE